MVMQIQISAFILIFELLILSETVIRSLFRIPKTSDLHLIKTELEQWCCKIIIIYAKKKEEKKVCALLYKHIYGCWYLNILCWTTIMQGLTQALCFN